MKKYIAAQSNSGRQVLRIAFDTPGEAMSQIHQWTLNHMTLPLVCVEDDGTIRTYIDVTFSFYEDELNDCPECGLPFYSSEGPCQRRNVEQGVEKALIF